MYHFHRGTTKICNSFSIACFVGAGFAGLFAIASLDIQINVWQIFPKWIARSIFKI